MSKSGKSGFAVAFWRKVGTRFLPFADAATTDLPLGRLLRLACFQLSVGMAIALMTGALNRVMIVELGITASFVAAVVALPVLAAPFRVMIGHKSDTHRSLLGWKRTPYIWFGALIQFGGFAIMPFALLLMESQTVGPTWLGPAAAGLAFLLVGIGLHTTQTAGIALATDLSPEARRPRVVALLYVMLLFGLIGASLVFSALLADFSPKRLIQVIQGAAVFTLFINVAAVWKQEARNPAATAPNRVRPTFRKRFAAYKSNPRAFRLLMAVGLGSAAFSMQDVLLEPYGGEILGLSVAQTTLLTGLWAVGALIGFAYAGRRLGRGAEMHRLAALGALIGVAAFAAVIFAGPLESAWLFRLGACLIGLGGGLFAVGGMIAAMDLAQENDSGLAIGAWGAVQATAIGLSLAAGGFIKDIVNTAALNGSLGEALAGPATGYNVVYHIEIGLLFLSLAVLGPLVGSTRARQKGAAQRIGLAELPG